MYSIWWMDHISEWTIFDNVTVHLWSVLASSTELDLVCIIFKLGAQ